MPAMKFRRSLPAFLVPLLLVACSQPEPQPAPVKPAVVVDPVGAVHRIRTAGDGLDSAVQVQPLRDPAIDGFLTRAHSAEAAKNFTAALEAADAALKLAPDAPDIVQYIAELEIGRGDWQRAETFAVRSYSLGPKVGSLCARNWQTVVEARTAMDDAAEVAKAKQRLKDCRVPPRVRM
ncbi:tetratricopeptide repeat protein [Dokdonella sp.]|uniref:tetratricopeptide repeat protein n=1 Tax=Dokdonella sp. TaxID=2291710 RepID=UPI002610F9C2|nr:tetratricopeptide repeat protein [Dokdonella sp.]